MERGAVGQHGRVVEGHEGERHVGEVGPGLDRADVGHVHARGRRLADPPLPGPTGGDTGLEHQPPARHERVVDAPQRRGPRVVGEEHLRDVRRHRREVDLERGEGRRVAVQPAHALGARLRAGDVERRTRRVEAHHLDAALREQARERPGAAPDVEHSARAQLVDDRDVGVEVGPVRGERVVESGEAGVVEDGVGHPTTVGRTPGDEPRLSIRRARPPSARWRPVPVPGRRESAFAARGFQSAAGQGCQSPPGRVARRRLACCPTPRASRVRPSPAEYPPSGSSRRCATHHS